MPQECPLPAFFGWEFTDKLTTNRVLRRLPGLLAGIIFFSNLSLAVCPGSRHQTSLAGYALSPDAARIAAIARDGALFWWDVAGGKRTQLAECIQPQVFEHPILFSPDSARLAVAERSGVQVFEISTGNVIARLTSPELKEVDSVIFSGDERRLAAGSQAGVAVWAINGPAELAWIPVHLGRNELALSRDGALLALARGDGIELWTVPAKGPVRSVAGGVNVESVLFAHQDRWIVTLTATRLPHGPKDRWIKYKREIAVWDAAGGSKLKTLKTDAELEELPFGLTSADPDQILAVDYKDHLRAWDLDSGELKATWETSSGHPSADGKFLLREGGAEGRLELWEIGGAEKNARPFAYKSPLCAESFADQQGNIKFEGLFMADGFSEEDEPIGSMSSQGYVAQDCTPFNIMRLRYKTKERARQELDRSVTRAIEVLEKGPSRMFSEERRVLRFSRRGNGLGPFVILWIEERSLIEISSSSLPVALAVEKQVLGEK